MRLTACCQSRTVLSMSPAVNPEDAWTRFAMSVFKVNGIIIRAGEGITNPLGQSSARWQVLGRAYEPTTVAKMAQDIGANVLRHLRHRRRLVGPSEYLPTSTALAERICDSLASPDDDPVDLEDTHGEPGPGIFGIDCWRHGQDCTRLTACCQSHSSQRAPSPQEGTPALGLRLGGQGQTL